MTKYFRPLALILSLAFILAGCGGAASSAAPAASGAAPADPAASDAAPAADAPAGEVLELRIGTIYADNTPTGMAALKFAELVKERTNGQIIINHFPSEQLGTENEMLESVGMGAIDFTAPGSALCGTFAKPYLIFSIPFLIEDWDHLTAVMEGEIGQAMAAELTAVTGARVLAGNWYREPRYLYGSKPVDELADLAGFRIRVPENPAWVKGWAKLGASPTPIALTEVYSSIETGAIDGAETTISYYTSNGIDMVADYFVNSAHMYEANLLVASEAAMSKMTPEQQEIVTQAAIEAGEYHQQIVLEGVDKLIEQIRAGENNQVLEIDRAAWIAQMEGIEDDEEVWSTWGDQELYGRIKALA